jgi:predicted adenylyl cyclase CyaB
MAIETEVKIKIGKKEFDERVKQLWKDNLSEPRFIAEHNDFYEVPRGFLRLKRFGNWLKVTFKGPRQDSDEFNSREEIEFHYPVWQYDGIKYFYEAMGLKKCFQYVKQRADYIFDDGPVASFDILPNGDRYIEIEDSEETIRNIVSLLKLQDFPIEKRSYLELLTQENDGAKKEHNPSGRA